MLGGLARRATVIKDFLKNNPNTLILDGGNLADNKKLACFILGVMKELGSNIMGIGNLDAKIGKELFDAAKEKGMQVIEAGPNRPEVAVPYIVKEINGIKIGIISFGSLGDDTEARSFPVLRARYAAFKEARQASDILILMESIIAPNEIATDDWLQRNAQRLGSPDILITSAFRGSEIESSTVGKTFIVPIPPNARRVGIINIYAEDKSNPKMDFQSIELSHQIAEDQHIQELVKKYEDDQKTQGSNPP